MPGRGSDQAQGVNETDTGEAVLIGGNAIRRERADPFGNAFERRHHTLRNSANTSVSAIGRGRFAIM